MYISAENICLDVVVVMAVRAAAVGVADAEVVVQPTRPLRTKTARSQLRLLLILSSMMRQRTHRLQQTPRAPPVVVTRVVDDLDPVASIDC